MEEIIISGTELIYISAEAENIDEYNSVRFWHDGVEIIPSELKLVFYNDKERNKEEE